VSRVVEGKEGGGSEKVAGEPVSSQNNKGRLIETQEKDMSKGVKRFSF